jgi:hypothetical protein
VVRSGFLVTSFVSFGGATGPLREDREGESGASRGLRHAAPLYEKEEAERDGELMEKGGGDEPVFIHGRGLG